MNRKIVLALGLVLGVLGGIVVTPSTSAGAHAGAVFVMTNSTDPVRGNEIVMYRRAPNGDLSLVGYFPTGRLSNGDPQIGSGPAPTAQLFNLATGGALPLVSAQFDGLGSSNSLILSRDNRCLFAVNAGDNSVSSFRVRRNGLGLVSVVVSGGLFPVSLTEHRNILYVLNAGEQGTLAGFRIRPDCRLALLDDAGYAIVDLAGLTDSFPIPAPGEVLTTPAQASFTPDGTRLVLSIKGGDAVVENGNLVELPSGRMVVFPVTDAGILGAPVTTRFSFVDGTGGPFSFDFANRETIVVVHANSNTLASYTINRDGTLSLIDGPLAISAFAPCWLDVSGRFGRRGDGRRYVYTVSFGAPSGIREILGEDAGLPDLNGVLSGFRLNKDGTLNDLRVAVEYPDPSAVLGIPATGNHGIDVRIIDHFLYFLQPRTGMVGRLTINPADGSLTDLVNFGGLAPGLEPFAGLNSAINDFLERCFLAGDDPAPECALGSAHGITGF